MPEGKSFKTISFSYELKMKPASWLYTRVDLLSNNWKDKFPVS